jgi:elongation factor 1-alpha
MYVDKTYVVDGVGTVLSGSIMSGKLERGDNLYLGPTTDGEYIETKCRSIEIHYHQVEQAEAGQLVSLAVRNIDPEEVHRGMVISDTKPEPVKEFKAEVMILNHPTSIENGYEPVIHLETASETVELEPDNPPLLAGDKGETTVRFKFNPYVVEEGQRFVFREGNSKGVGTVTNTPTKPN